MRINLLPIEERPLDSYKLRWEFVLVLIGVILLLVVNGYGLMQALTVKSLNYEYENAVDHSFMLQLQQNEVVAMQEDNRILEDKIRYYQEITNETDKNLSIDSLTFIMESIPANIWLEDLEMQSTRILLRGYTFDTRTVSQFLRNLTSGGFLSTVKQLDQLAVGGLTSFVIEIERG